MRKDPIPSSHFSLMRSLGAPQGGLQLSKTDNLAITPILSSSWRVSRDDSPLSSLFSFFTLTS